MSSEEKESTHYHHPAKEEVVVDNEEAKIENKNSEDESSSMVRTPIEQQQSTTSEFKKLIKPKALFLALIFCGAQLIQELIAEDVFTQFTITRTTYETAMLYSMFQQLGTVAVALIALCSSSLSSNTQSTVPVSVTPSWIIMCILAILVFASTALPNWAVEFVYFPAKVVAKSTKLVPTMFVSVMMGNSKKFTMIDYISAFLLCTGAAGFALHSGRVDVDDQGVETVRENTYIGIILLTISSFADALVPNLQQVVMKAGASPEQVALRVNIVGASWVFIFLLISGGIEAWFFHEFLQQPELLLLMIGGAVTLGVAVLAYTMLIREAGSVVAVAVATARKVLTLTLSYIVFPGQGKTFGSSHAISAIAVALGMALGPIWERVNKCKKKDEFVYSKV